MEKVTDLININNLPTPTAPSHQHRLHHHQMCACYSALVTHSSSATWHTDHGGHASDRGGTTAPHTWPSDVQGHGNSAVKGRSLEEPVRALMPPLRITEGKRKAQAIKGKAHPSPIKEPCAVIGLSAGEGSRGKQMCLQSLPV